MAYGRGATRATTSPSAAVTEAKYMGPIVKTAMTRCIQCTRCVRFAEEVAGVARHRRDAVPRRGYAQITTYLERAFTSELSGNLVDLCPGRRVDQSKPYSFRGTTVGIEEGARDRRHGRGRHQHPLRRSRRRQVMRILPRINDAVNEEWAQRQDAPPCRRPDPPPPRPPLCAPRRPTGRSDVG